MTSRPFVPQPLTREERIALHREIHARPPAELEGPLAVTHLVLLVDAAGHDASRRCLEGMLTACDQPPPAPDSIFVQAQLQGLDVRWELHTEFVAWTFFRPLQAAELTALQHAAEPPTADAMLPTGWRDALPGSMLAGVQLWLLPQQGTHVAAITQQLFAQHSLTGSRVVSGTSELLTDMRLQPDGCVRVLILAGEPVPDKASPQRLGRLVQRVLEIETYRMAALLGLPAARRAVSWLAAGEVELATLAHAVRDAMDTLDADEPALLTRLSHLAAELEDLYAATHARYWASAAYYDLVNQRLSELNEQRIERLQPLGEFMQRRLNPAMATCRSADRRQAALSARIARVGDLLRTRVEVTQQLSSRQLLAAMDRRQRLQLKLQTTVEGLSVAAITYYAVGLVAYLARGARAAGWPVSVEVSTALAVPVVASSVWLGLRRLHHRIAHADVED